MKTTNLVTGLASTLLALALCTATSRAESPVFEVTLAGHDFVAGADGVWRGTPMLTVEGVDYEGTGAWQATELRINATTLHWFAEATFDFGDLGSIEIWENGKMSLLEPNAGLSGMTRIIGGTGIFANAHGVLQYDVYTFEPIGGVPTVNFVLSGHLFLGDESDE